MPGVFRRPFVVPPNVQGYGLATLSYTLNVTLVADTGVFVLNGVDATYVNGLTADPAAFTLTGQDVLFNVTMVADPGAFVLTGQDALGSGVLVADTGAFILTGNDTQSIHGLGAETGVFTLTGFDAGGLIQAVPDPGSAIVRGTFSRGQWRDYRDVKRKEQERQERAAREKADREAAERKRKREEQKAAREAARFAKLQALNANSAMLDHSLFMREVGGIGPGIGQMDHARQMAIASLAAAEQLHAKRVMEQEEQEAIDLLMAS